MRITKSYIDRIGIISYDNCGVFKRTRRILSKKEHWKGTASKPVKSLADTFKIWQDFLLSYQIVGVSDIKKSGENLVGEFREIDQTEPGEVK